MGKCAEVYDLSEGSIVKFPNSRGEMKAYIYKDNVVLTAIGLLLGCICGLGIGYLSIILLEGEVNRYVRTANPIACLLGVLVGIVFAVIVNVIALRKIHTLNLTNVNGN